MLLTQIRAGSFRWGRVWKEKKNIIRFKYLHQYLWWWGGNWMKQLEDGGAKTCSGLLLMQLLWNRHKSVCVSLDLSGRERGQAKRRNSDYFEDALPFLILKLMGIDFQEVHCALKSGRKTSFKARYQFKAGKFLGIFHYLRSMVWWWVNFQGHIPFKTYNFFFFTEKSLEWVAHWGGGVTISGNIQEKSGCGPQGHGFGLLMVALGDPESLLQSWGFGIFKLQHFNVLFGSEGSRTEVWPHQCWDLMETLETSERTKPSLARSPCS